ncbi:MAG: ATP-binding protein [Noviherbaspirillum sp.]
MTLRVRLMAIIGLSFTILWLATSVWMFLDVRKEFRDALDERLAASARMVAGLVAQLPDPAHSGEPITTAVLDVVGRDGVACEVRMLRGDIIARTGGTPKGLGLATVGYHTRNVGGQLWRSYTYEQAGKRVTTADRLELRRHLLRNIALSMFVPFLVAMAGSLAVLWFGISKGLAPLEEMRRALAERRPDALEPLPAKTVPGEIAPLVTTLNSLLERTRKAMERERRFTGDAAHELRTPLTAMKTHIQVARLASAGQANAALGQAEQGAWRLQHTLEQLLMLARVEGPFAFDAGDLATAGEIIARVKNEFAPDQRRRITLDAGQVGNLAVAVSPALAVTALRNLVDNALRYSPQEAAVRLSVESDGTRLRFCVRDDGPGMSDAERTSAVQRFWRRGHGEGSGLGLSIVDAIARRFGGTFELLARPEGGTLAMIQVPHGQA